MVTKNFIMCNNNLAFPCNFFEPDDFEKYLLKLNNLYLQLREQRDRAEKDLKEEKDLHDREITDFKMKIHTLESELEKLQMRLDKALTEKDKLEVKLEFSQTELGKFLARYSENSFFIVFYIFIEEN